MTRSRNIYPTPYVGVDLGKRFGQMISATMLQNLRDLSFFQRHPVTAAVPRGFYTVSLRDAQGLKGSRCVRPYPTTTKVEIKLPKVTVS